MGAAPEPSEPINVSALNQYGYCPRRCGLIYLEGEFEDNVHTSRGNAEHARVEYALPIFSDRLRLIGRCDVVEFWPDGTVYPVEYKHGPRRAWLNDDVQLGAQAMCLEDMFHVRIDQAAIFHASSKRREVRIDAALRDAVVTTVKAIRAMLDRRKLPPYIADQRRCRERSLRDVCMPEFGALPGKAVAARTALFDPDSERGAARRRPSHVRRYFAQSGDHVPSSRDQNQCRTAKSRHPHSHPQTNRRLCDRLTAKCFPAVVALLDFGAYSVRFDGKPVAAGESPQSAPGVTLLRRC